MLFFFLMIRRPPRSTLFPLHDALPISQHPRAHRGRRARKAIGEAHGDVPLVAPERLVAAVPEDRKSTRLNSSHVEISYAVFCLKKKKKISKSHPMLPYQHYSNHAA